MDFVGIAVENLYIVVDTSAGIPVVQAAYCNRVVCSI